MSPRIELVEHLYSILDELSDRCGGPRTLAVCDGRMGWPRRGVYFFFEPGEYRHGATGMRVVRVGTHALRPSGTSLWQRLAQHRGTTGGALAGGGNHRGSIFRLHVGEALLAAGGFPPEIARTWGRGSTAPPEVRRTEHPLECAVSAHIRAMPLLWLAVDDPPTPASDRGVIEVGSLGLLSNLSRLPIDPPSPGWLGRHSTRPAIRESGLWNVNHVQASPDGAFLPVMRTYAEAAGVTSPERSVPAP